MHDAQDAQHEAETLPRLVPLNDWSRDLLAHDEAIKAYYAKRDAAHYCDEDDDVRIESYQEEVRRDPT